MDRLGAAADSKDESANLVLAGFLALVTAAIVGGPKGAAAGALIFSGTFGRWLADDDDLLQAIEDTERSLDTLLDCIAEHDDELPPSGEFLIIPFDE